MEPTAATPGTEPQTPPTFDAAGETWTIRLNIDLIEQINDHHQLDLLPPNGEQPALMPLLFDFRRLSRILCTLLEPQLRAKQIPAAEFRAKLEAEELCTGFWAMVQSLVFFSRQLMGEQTAKLLEKTIETQWEATQLGGAALLEIHDDPSTKKAIDQQLELLKKQTNEELQKALAKLPIGSPAS